MTLSRRTLLLPGSVSLAAALLAPERGRAETTETLASVRTAKVMVIGNGGAFPPFEYMENGTVAGYDRDLGDELCRRMGLRPQWTVMDFAGLIPALTSGRVDILISALAKTDDRAKRIGFSAAYYKTGVAAAYRPDVSVVHPQDLAGKVIGVQTGTSGELFVRDAWADKVKELKTYPEFPLAMRDLEIGRVEAVVNTMPTLRYNLARANKAGLKLSEVWDAHRHRHQHPAVRREPDGGNQPVSWRRCRRMASSRPTTPNGSGPSERRLASAGRTWQNRRGRADERLAVSSKRCDDLSGCEPSLTAQPCRARRFQLLHRGHADRGSARS